MPSSHGTTPTTGQGSPRRPRGGVVSGYVLRLIREQLDLPQDGLAEQLRVSADTVAGWETGRRPLTAVPVGQMLVHRHRLLRLGAQPALLAALDKAMEADVLLTSVIEDDGDADASPLGAWVMQRDLVELLAWPLTGDTPEALREVPQPRKARRGPAAPSPQLPAPERTHLFSQLRRTAETATAPGTFLLRRQALYLAGYDHAPDASAWLAEQQRRRAPDDWLSRWLAARSVASVATRFGDRDRLAHFVGAELLDDDRGEAANLEYWAYWVGEIQQIELSDDFMATGRTGAWEGRKLFRHLLARLAPAHGYLDLYVHTMRSLLAARLDLLRATAGGAEALRERVAVLLDDGHTSAQARRELDAILYAIRLSQA
ncbi:transcriptional regulator [Nocardiopsis gilva YIM 90087]|uniref:Transcriptional regulator n=1 Tax=Nocardiopsis gilva YIM 90087 TaxID=1235441 RepID=A0A223S3Q6_9ACTN|nr:helix-turn-helix transcriptional regulator [Nocardiopsis gilva]ASU82748.1 transcriptional regulator [Nocardiopsis gilva YIM 90087]